MGRQQFSQPINVVSQTGQSMKKLSVSSAAVLAISTNETLYIYAPAKTVARINVFNTSFPVTAAATSGTKEIFVDQSSGGTALGVVQVTGAFGSGLAIDRNIPISSTTSLPTTEGTFQANLKGAAFDDVTPLAITFKNKTNGATAAGEIRTVNVFALVEVVS